MFLPLRWTDLLLPANSQDGQSKLQPEVVACAWSLAESAASLGDLQLGEFAGQLLSASGTLDPNSIAPQLPALHESGGCANGLSCMSLLLSVFFVFGLYLSRLLPDTFIFFCIQLSDYVSLTDPIAYIGGYDSHCESKTRQNTFEEVHRQGCMVVYKVGVRSLNAHSHKNCTLNSGASQPV